MAKFKEWNDGLVSALRQPFPPAVISWKPQSVAKDRTGGLGVPYVDPRWYFERLDQLVGPQGWDMEIDVIGTGQIIVKLTILGVRRFDLGEKDARDANTLAAALAQAFKRTCAQGFGLGRYLYQFIEQTYAEMRPVGEKSATWTKAGRAKLSQAAEAGTENYLAYLADEGNFAPRDPFGPEEPEGAPHAANEPQPKMLFIPKPEPAPRSTPAPRPAPAPQPEPVPTGPGATTDGIPELNFRLRATNTTKKHFDSGRDEVTLGELWNQGGDEGKNYVRWVSGSSKNEKYRDAAAAVVAYYDGKAPAPIAASPEPAGAPPTGWNENINNMNALCDAFGVSNPGDLYHRLVPAVWKKVPLPDETEAWKKAYEYIVQKSGADKPPFDQ